MRTTLELPDLIKEKGVDQEYIKEAIAALLYYNGKITEMEACQMTGCTRRNFEEIIIPKFSLSMIGGTQEDVEFEVNATL